MSWPAADRRRRRAGVPVGRGLIFSVSRSSARPSRAPTRLRDSVSIFLANEPGPSGFDSPKQHAHGAYQHVVTACQCAHRRLGSSAPPLTILTAPLQRRSGVQRSSGRRRPQLGPNDGELEDVGEFRLLVDLGKKTVTSSGGVEIMGGPAGLTVNPTGRRRCTRPAGPVGQH